MRPSDATTNIEDVMTDDRRAGRARGLRTMGRRGAPFLLAAGLALGGTGCSDLLDVELPSRVPEETLDDPSSAEVLVNSVIADFECAFSNYIAATGLLTDELIISTEFIAPTSWDLRQIASNNGNLGTGGCTAFGFGVYQPISTARFQADDAFRRLQEFPDGEVTDKTGKLATVSAYGGYALTLLGEGFCRAAVDHSPELQPAEVLRMAEERFSRAIELGQQAGASEIVNMARVGRARVRLNLGDAAGAVADAEQVPAGFVKNATYSGTSARRENTIFVYNHRDLMISVDPRFRDLDVQGTPDPRVPVADANRVGHDGFTELFLVMKYANVGSPIELATWEEAQLIIAEAEGGQAAVDAINRLRQDEGLPAFQSNDAAEIAAQVREERRRELYLESHRLNDMLRNDIPFDTGLNHKGVPFGNTTCLPLPDSEIQNNPNIDD